MRSYKHLSLEERENLFALKKAGWSFRQIALQLNRPHSGLIREFKRNTKTNGEYIPCQAQKLSDIRNRKQRSKAPLKGLTVLLYVKKHLQDPYKWSPEQIAGRLQIDRPGKHITKETIYRYIYAEKNRHLKLWQYLTRQRKKRMTRGGRRVYRGAVVPGSASIETRPKEVEQRLTPGHWETDNLMGKMRDKLALSVSVERLTRFTILSLLPRKGATEKANFLLSRLTTLPKAMRSTLTTDKGIENAFLHQIIFKIQMPVYFCHPYSSWEKGTVENTNGRIRRYLPRRQSLDGVTPEQIMRLEKRLNSTPRKCLNYLTPYERMKQVLT